jgi:hypothetical protein
MRPSPALDAQILKSVQKQAHYLNKGFSICWMRFGSAFIIGLLRLAGDFADIGLNYYLVLRKAWQADLPGTHAHEQPSQCRRGVHTGCWGRRTGNVQGE